MFIQSLMGLKNLYDAKPVAIWVLGKPAEGDLKRPFKGAGGMFGGKLSYIPNHDRIMLLTTLRFIASGEPQTDKAAIEEAEKKVGKKEE